VNRLLVRHERDLSVDHTADRVAYIELSFGLLAVVAYRSFAEGVASWELLGLVLLGGAVSAGYRLWRGNLTRQAALMLVITAIVALLVSAVVVLGLRT
jgi:hypothetical protein